MKSRSFLLRCVQASLLGLATASLVHATPPPSDPVGNMHLALRGASDTVVSLPLHRPVLGEAAIASRSASQLILDTTISALPAEGAYALVMTGTLEGAVLPVTALSDTALTVDATGYDLASLQTVAANSAGDTLAVIPYWTLGTLFPAGAGIYPSTSIMSVKTQVLMFDDSITGTNLSASATYFYFSGTGYAHGWYRYGDMSATCDNTRLPPHHYFIVRHPTGTADSDLMALGQVQMSGARVALATRAASRAQDNLVALPIPVPVSLDNSGLTGSGAFTPSASILSVKDQLLVFDNTATGRNKSASATYFYFSGNGFYAAGWYRYGDLSHTVGDVLLKPSEGYIIRKASTTTPQTSFWNVIPSYLQ